MGSFVGFLFVRRVVCPSWSLSLAMLLACRAFRRADLVAGTGPSTSWLALRGPLLRVARPGCGVVAIDGGCGVGVMRRLDDRTDLRSAIQTDQWLYTRKLA